MAADKKNTIKIAVIAVAILAAIALPAWYFMGSKTLPPAPPPTNNATPTPEQIQELRPRPSPTTIDAGA